MRLKNVLLVVSDIERSKKFYQEIFGLRVVSDFGENVILTEGLVLQEKTLWEEMTGQEVTMENGAELFFEENDFDGFLRLLSEHKEVEIVGDVRKNAWERRVVMLKDPDGHLEEVAEVKIGGTNS